MHPEAIPGKFWLPAPQQDLCTNARFSLEHDPARGNPEDTEIEPVLEYGPDGQLLPPYDTQGRPTAGTGAGPSSAPHQRGRRRA
ncbi:hypothetical protein PGTUg99_025668 [Puccinia graminis f. sp. tritici]|uniref:Uncharacterized protein n=1 Tax=Puccinia graminis f. sp. tritici TaxID=56615 RepID=A0A5B0SD40_PUCGR|nr:hypothetical protein PGTUg99_030378 [Puccinia graminis f. sp. tritici]KAA1136061.1 hypothetical protein PGTUg99_025668 [Puccinia graminis f. sp. tritici]